MSFSKSKPGSNEENKENKIDYDFLSLKQRLKSKQPKLRTARDMLAKCKVYQDHIVEQKQGEKYKDLSQCIHNCITTLEDEDYYGFLTHFEKFKIITDQQDFSLTKIFHTKNAFKTEMEELMKNDEWKNQLSVTLFNFEKYTEEKIKPFKKILKLDSKSDKDYVKARTYEQLKNVIKEIKEIIENPTGLSDKDIINICIENTATIISTVQALDEADYQSAKTEKARFAISLRDGISAYIHNKFGQDDSLFKSRLDSQIKSYKTLALKK